MNPSGLDIPFHPWHHISHPRAAEHVRWAVVEIPMGSRVKYELDKPTGLLRMDRILYGSLHYPVNYGFIPQTLDSDGDPLDILVLCSERLEPLSLVEVRIIGVMQMIDSDTNDDKIIAVPLKDMELEHVQGLKNLSPHGMVMLKNFFESYKVLENKRVDIERFDELETAEKVIAACEQRYREKFSVPR